MKAFFIHGIYLHYILVEEGHTEARSRSFFRTTMGMRGATKGASNSMPWLAWAVFWKEFNPLQIFKVRILSPNDAIIGNGG